uniref:Solute carrier family 15 member 2-like n=1 Tax=Gouania willdenowi TaxID=441366 RepID=A0A8C5N7T0_GOUWI
MSEIPSTSGHNTFYFSDISESISEIICFIVVNEFCERFSYYGMKALLTLYFLTYLGWDPDLSTAIYHAFSSLCYFTPILGAIIADSWLGKFKTIIYLSVVYVIGHVVKSVGAIPTVGNKDVHIALSMLGLILIALGTGGIKPCVAAFGGDQFEEEHVSERQKFFSIFYMSINAGSLLSTIITPILRSDVQCFGDDCYALAFGVPAILMIVALVVFIAGSSLYKRNPPQGNILLQVCNCIGFAIKNRVNRHKYDPPRKHWLDWAEDKYSKRLIQEIKMVLRVLLLYIPLPMFWALFDQQVSRGHFLAFGGSVSIKPDQMQMLNALLILVFVPIFDLGIYPLIGLCRVNITPLRKMATGMIFAALAFGAATLVEINVMVCGSSGRMLYAGAYLTFWEPKANFCEASTSLYDHEIFGILEHLLCSFVLTHNGTTSTYAAIEKASALYVLHCLSSKLKSIQMICGEAFAWRDDCRLISITVLRQQQHVVHHLLLLSMIEVKNVLNPRRYADVSCSTQSRTCSDLNLGLLDFGASYTFILKQVRDILIKMIDVNASDVHITWQIPQYALMTAGEVMFSITGLEFSYSQAPANMKSVLQAGWLLTVAFGNVIVLIVAEGAGLEQWKEFLLFMGLLLAVCIIFSVMAHFYTYVDPDQLQKMHREDFRGNE